MKSVVICEVEPCKEPCKDEPCKDKYEKVRGSVL